MQSKLESTFVKPAGGPFNSVVFAEPLIRGAVVNKLGDAAGEDNFLTYAVGKALQGRPENVRFMQIRFSDAETNKRCGKCGSP